MKKSFFNKYPFNPSHSETEWFGGSLISAIILTGVSFLLRALDHSNGGIEFFAMSAWLSFVFMLVFIFVSTALAIYGVLILGSVIVYIGNFPWYYYLVMPLGVGLAIVLGVTTALFGLVFLHWIYKNYSKDREHESSELAIGQFAYIVGQWIVDVVNLRSIKKATERVKRQDISLD